MVGIILRYTSEPICLGQELKTKEHKNLGKIVESCFFSGELQKVLNMTTSRGARSARADAKLCTSSGINSIVPLSFPLVR